MEIKIFNRNFPTETNTKGGKGINTVGFKARILHGLKFGFKERILHVLLQLVIRLIRIQ